jgi:hypothetical protein
MEYPQTRVFHSKTSAITTVSPTNTILSQEKKFITKTNELEFSEKNLRILFEKNIALQSLDYLDDYTPDGEDQSFSQLSLSNLVDNSFFSNSNNELLYLY